MSTGHARLAVRWTIGDVSENGYEALRLSVWGAWKLFGAGARYTVCINTVPLEVARARAGELPDGVRWRRSERAELPPFLAEHLDPAMAEGVAWKFAPLQLDEACHTLALDNDCILWEIPAAIRAWLESVDPRACVLAEDVRPCFGRFAELCGEAPRNSGIRALAPGFDLEGALRQILGEHPRPLTSETDEQGLQVAALTRHGAPGLITLDEVSITSPFPPHLPDLGRCGAHFVGLNARSVPWSLHGRPATEHLAEHWARHREELYRRVGIAPVER
jgi:hypothetical protein